VASLERLVQQTSTSVCLSQQLLAAQDSRVLVRDLILPELDHVVRLAAQTLRTVVDDAQHVLRRLPVRRVRLEPIPQHFDRSSSETR